MIKDNPILKHALMLFGRALLATIFIVAGIDKIIHYDHYTQLLTTQHIPLPVIVLGIGLAFELLGGLLLLLGFKTRLGACMLLIFVIPATLIFHDFWSFQPEHMTEQCHHFLKNLAIFGGLLYVLAVGAGKYSLDCKCQCKHEHQHQ
jgi:putative oxidoreductase